MRVEYPCIKVTIIQLFSTVCFQISSVEYSSHYGEWREEVREYSSIGARMFLYSVCAMYYIYYTDTMYSALYCYNIPVSVLQ